MATHEETAYDALNQNVEDHRWAFGTGFADPLAGVDTSIPSGVDGDDLSAYCLMLGDDALIGSHRLQEWTTRAPELEEEAALANIALDLLGQARMLLSRAGRAGRAQDGEVDEDSLAFGRTADQFRNVRLVEGVDGDFAEMIARLLVFSTWRLAVFDRLRESRDPVLAAIADKGVKELTYHRDYAADWTVRLGDGTELSHRRMQAAVDTVWPLVDELFTAHPVERRLVGVAVDPATVRDEVDAVLGQVLAAATLTRPTVSGSAGLSGRDGVHTDAMIPLLTEFQSVARATPGATW